MSWLRVGANLLAPLLCAKDANDSCTSHIFFTHIPTFTPFQSLRWDHHHHQPGILWSRSALLLLAKEELTHLILEAIYLTKPYYFKWAGGYLRTWAESIHRQQQHRKAIRYNKGGENRDKWFGALKNVNQLLNVRRRRISSIEPPPQVGRC